MDSSRNTDDDFGAYLALGKATEKYNFELSAWGYKLSGFNDNDMWGTDLGIYRVWYRERRLTPYFGAAFGFIKNQNNRQPDEQGAQNSLAFGLLTDLTSSRTIALRTEFRWRLDYSGPSTEHDYIANVGLQIPFGGKPEPVVAAVDPDSDGDGVPDSQDRCPGTPAGVAVDAYGCPLDSDGDGVPDYLDKCPGTPAGTAVDASGCPLPQATQSAAVTETGTWLYEDIKFDTGSATIKAASFPVLAEIATVLKQNPNLKVEIQGHTDSRGSLALNERLSQQRAEAVRDYLMGQGIASERLTARGYGPHKPIASNETADGRAQNRRVELKPLQ